MYDQLLTMNHPKREKITENLNSAVEAAIQIRHNHSEEDAIAEIKKRYADFEFLDEVLKRSEVVAKAEKFLLENKA